MSAAKKASAAPTLNSEEARQQAQAERLMLLVADNKTGYFGVSHLPGKPKPYVARVKRGGKSVHLGSFATAEEAALCVARTPEGKAAAAKARARAASMAASLELTSEEARLQAKAEKLVLPEEPKNPSGYYGVYKAYGGRWAAWVRRASQSGDKQVCLGNFATPDEAALHVARSPEGVAREERMASEVLSHDVLCLAKQAHSPYCIILSYRIVL